jgi:dienelactone hydrolase
VGRTIELKAADGHILSAYVAGPDNATRGIVVIQEIFGVNHHMRDMADRFGAAGYAPSPRRCSTARRKASNSAIPRMTSARVAIIA